MLLFIHEIGGVSTEVDILNLIDYILYDSTIIVWIC